MKTIKNIFNHSVPILISKRIIATLLAFFYLLAFVMSPYWSLITSKFGVIIILTAIIGLGVVWVYLSADNIQINSGIKTFLLMGILLAGMAALNYGALTSVIPWRGDESTFIIRTRDLISRLPIKFVLLASFLFAFLIFAVARKSRWMILTSILFETCVIIQFFVSSPFNGIGAVLLLRWPYFNYWFYAIAPLVAKYLWDPNHEFLYRVIPLVAATGMVWVVQMKLKGTNFFNNLLWMLSIATIPIVFYYSSILYMDFSAVFLMVIVCFHATDLLRNDFKNIKHNPGWIALVLVGFVKETAIVFLLCFLLCRTVFVLLNLMKTPNKGILAQMKFYLREEMPVLYCILFPYLIYIFFRVYLTDIRSYIRTYSPNVLNLFNLDLYKITTWSFILQFGIFLPFFFWGVFLLYRRKDYLIASFILLLFIGVPIFYGLDSQSQAYIGYSRFNLFVLPAILLGSVAALNQISNWGKTSSVAFACLAIAANLVISPVHLDGTKVPFWGNYLLDTSEHYYPYDKALLWIRNNQGSRRILFSEMFYNYYLSFYFAKFNWHPTYDTRISAEGVNETLDLTDTLSEAGQQGYSLVLYQVSGKNIPQPLESGDFCLERVFRNQAHILLLFSRIPNCALTSN